MDIISLVSSILEPLEVPTIYGWYDENLKQTHITFLEFDNLESEFADDEATQEEHYIQVDLWTFDVEESQSIKAQIKELMKENDCLYQGGQDLPEPQSDGSCLFHIATRWLITESLE